MNYKSISRYFLLTLLVSMLGHGNAAALEAYVNIESDCLGFYYDDNRIYRHGRTYSLNDVDEDGLPVWNVPTRNVAVSISFDDSFRNYRPKSTKNWFFYFAKLENIFAIQNLNTSEVTDMSYMFYDCEALTSLDLSTFDTRNVQNFTKMLCNCRNLQNLKLKGWNTEKATNMTGMISFCYLLRTIDLSDFRLPNVERMSTMFMECKELIALTLTLNNAKKLTRADNMFFNCKKLRRIYTASDWNTPALSNSDGMFNYCLELVGMKGTAYNASHLDKAYAHLDGGSQNPGYLSQAQLAAYVNYNQSAMGFFYDYFMGARDGRSFYIPDDPNDYPQWANYSDTEIKVAVFYESFADYRPKVTRNWFRDRSQLKYVWNLKNLNTSEVTDMSLMFYGCKALTSLDLSTFDTRKVTKMYGMFWNCENLETLNISSFNTSNVVDLSNMFGGCLALTSLNLKNFNTSNVKYMGSMFEGCKSISSLDLSNFDTQNVVGMSCMFRSCEKLSQLNIRSFKTGKVTNMKEMFDHCLSLRTLDLSHFDTSNVTNMDTMFWDCIELSSLDVSSFNTSKLTSMHMMFCNCPKLQTLKLNSFDTHNVTTMSRMFENSSGLTFLDLSSFNTSKVKDMSDMFWKCEKLKTIYVSPGWSTDNVTQSNFMFYDCKSLVGEKGTVYDEDYINHFYARVDGGSTRPGYFTLKLILGDVNLDGKVNSADVQKVYQLMAQAATAVAYPEADVNNDNRVNSADIQRIYKIMAALKK